MTFLQLSLKIFANRLWLILSTTKLLEKYKLFPMQRSENYTKKEKYFEMSVAALDNFFYTNFIISSNCAVKCK